MMMTDYDMIMLCSWWCSHMDFSTHAILLRAKNVFFENTGVYCVWNVYTCWFEAFFFAV